MGLGPSVGSTQMEFRSFPNWDAHPKLFHVEQFTTERHVG
jgi:hypothetical protein